MKNQSVVIRPIKGGFLVSKSWQNVAREYMDEDEYVKTLPKVNKLLKAFFAVPVKNDKIPF